MQNNLRELWSLLHWLYPDVFDKHTKEKFRTSFDLSRGKVLTAVLDSARRLLQLIMLRRMKDSPGMDLRLPPKTEVRLFVPLTPMQRSCYTKLLKGMSPGLLGDVLGDDLDKEKAAILDDSLDQQPEQMVSNLKYQSARDLSDGWKEARDIMAEHIEPNDKRASPTPSHLPLHHLIVQLQKCCNHPYLFPDTAPDPYELGDHIIQASGKLVILAKLVEECVLKAGKKMLIFSGMTEMLSLCEELLDIKSQHRTLFRYVRLDGSTCTARRNLHVRLFTDLDTNYKVFLISTKAGGVGLNLTSATEVVFLDEDWNPQTTLQAEARAHRIGQTKPVTVYKLCTQGTVEEQMLPRIQKKLYLSAKITESMQSVHTSLETSKDLADSGIEHDELASLGPSQLKSLLQKGTWTLSHQHVDVTEMLSWDWKTMLEKCKDSRTAPVDENSSTTVDEQTWLNSTERVKCSEFEGRIYKRKREGQDPNLDILGLPTKRKRKERTIKVDTEIGKIAVSRDNLALQAISSTPPSQTTRPKIEHQPFCQVCWDGTGGVRCESCPRTYHFHCLSDEYQHKAYSKKPFICPQHRCYICEKSAAKVGGMLYRCRWCENAFCEQHVEFDRTDLIGDELPELKDLDIADSAFFVRCYICRSFHESSEAGRSLYESRQEQVAQN